MKKMNRMLALLLAMIMVLSLSVSAFAAVTEVTEKGSILIKDTESVKASEKTFAAYRVLDLQVFENSEAAADAKYSYVYSVPTALKTFYANKFGVPVDAADFDAQVVAKIEALGEDNAQALFDFAEAALAAAKAAGVVPTTGAAATEGDDGYLISNLPLGYYVIADTTEEGNYIKPVSALILDTVTPDVETEVKAEVPTLDKDIDEDNDLTTTNDRVDANNAAIGDTVTYVIDSKVPSMLGYEKYFFIVNDTLSAGLAYKNDLTVKIGNETLVLNEDYTFSKTENADGTTSLKIVFKNFIQYNTEAYVDQPITITYTAIVDNDALVGKDPNTNTADLTFSNNPNEESNGKPGTPDEPDENDPVGETPDSVVKTFVTALEIIKTDPAGKRLDGAEFKLEGTALNIVRVETESFEKDNTNGTHWLLKDGTYTETDPATEGISDDNYVSTTDKYVKTTNVEYKTAAGETLSVTATVGEDGVVRFEGLKAGTYKLTETKAPAGYNALDEAIDVTITWDETNGFTFEPEEIVEIDETGSLTIVNQGGTKLPSTGGMGTTLLYIIGGIMVMGAVVVLITKKRMAE